MKITHAKQLIAVMEAQGWRVDSTRDGHFQGKHPGGTGMVTFADSRDPSAIKNAVFQARRAGLVLDEDKEKEPPVAGTQSEPGLISRKRVLLEKCAVKLTGQQLAEAVYQYIQKKTGIYPPTPPVKLFDCEGTAYGHDDFEAVLEWQQERTLKEGETA